jgi:hypothetical protein
MDEYIGNGGKDFAGSAAKGVVDHWGEESGFRIDLYGEAAGVPGYVDRLADVRKEGGRSCNENEVLDVDVEFPFDAVDFVHRKKLTKEHGIRSEDSTALHAGRRRVEGSELVSGEASSHTALHA